MKGILFDLLERFLASRAGEEEARRIVAQRLPGRKEPWVAAETYPDEDLAPLLDGAVERLGGSRADLLREFGKFAFPKLAELFPAYVVRYPHPKQFLLALDSIIHVEVGKRYEGAQPPSFVCTDPAALRLVMEYRSERRLCHLVEGLIEGVAAIYSSPIKCKQTRCVLDGDEVCEFDLRFKK